MVHLPPDRVERSLSHILSKRKHLNFWRMWRLTFKILVAIFKIRILTCFYKGWFILVLILTFFISMSCTIVEFISCENIQILDIRLFSFHFITTASITYNIFYFCWHGSFHHQSLSTHKQQEMRKYVNFLKNTEKNVRMYQGRR